VEVGTANLFVDTTNGRVGVGTATPVTPFEVVVGTSAAPLTTEMTVMQLGSKVDGSSSDHTSYFKFKHIPESNPVDWSDWSGRLQFVTDTTNQGYIEFNPPGSNYGIAFGNEGGGGNAVGEIMRLLYSGEVGVGTATPGAKLTVSGTENTFDPIFQINDWKTLTWSGNNITGNRDVTIITHNGVDTGLGVIGGIVEVICFRGGYGQQRAYAKFHVNYSYWTSGWRGHFDALEKDMSAQTNDITIVTSNSPAKIDVRITSPTGTLGQYYIKFHGPIYNKN
jgi:hypothetical protein